MKEYFENIVKFTLNYEKYKSNDPHDPGGLTIWGFASKYHPIEVAAMENMSPEDAKKRAIELYYNLYWFAGGCDKLLELSSQALFDICVNPGTGAAVRFLQHIFGTKEDGVLGPNTKKLIDDNISKHNDKELATALITMREDWYKAKHNDKFEHGWLNRCSDLRKFLNISTP